MNPQTVSSASTRLSTIGVSSLVLLLACTACPNAQDADGDPDPPRGEYEVAWLHSVAGALTADELFFLGGNELFAAGLINNAPTLISGVTSLAGELTGALSIVRDPLGKAAETFIEDVFEPGYSTTAPEVVFGDLDGDGDEDVVLRVSRVTIVVLENREGTLALARSMKKPGFGQPAMLDFDGDGGNDALFPARYGEVYVVRLVDGVATAATRLTGDISLAAFGVVDGALFAIARSNSGAASIRDELWRLDTQLEPTAALETGLEDSERILAFESQVVTVGYDYVADIDEVGARRAVFADLDLTSAGASIAGVDVEAVGDLDGDGSSSLIAVGSARAGAPEDIVFADGATQPFVFDLDGDGVQDAVFSRVAR